AIGWTGACPTGFKAAASGWGCTAVVPPAACTRASMAVLGETSCVPIGDCARPFPPPNTSIVVDPRAKPDATHARTIAAALESAAPGATVAIATGTYDESLVLRRDVTIVGRCARDVVIRSPAQGTGAGVDVMNAVVGISGVTLDGHLHGVAIGDHA